MKILIQNTAKYQLKWIFQMSKTQKKQYVYMIREREFVRSDMPVYKIGKTTQSPNARLRKYPKHSQDLEMSSVPVCDYAEKQIIAAFDKAFTKITDCGTEYYAGNESSMKQLFKAILLTIEMINSCAAVKELNKSNESIGFIDDLDVPYNENAPSFIDDLDEPMPNESTQNTQKPVQVKPRKVYPVVKDEYTFVKSIYDSEPDWYVPGKYVDFQVILKNYREHTGDLNSTASLVSRTLNKKLFNGSKKTGTGVVKKLLPIEALA